MEGNKNGTTVRATQSTAQCAHRTFLVLALLQGVLNHGTLPVRGAVLHRRILGDVGALVDDGRRAHGPGVVLRGLLRTDTVQVLQR